MIFSSERWAVNTYTRKRDFALSPADRRSRAIERGADKLRAVGLDPVLEPFKIPNLWPPVSAEAMAIAPQQFSIRLAAAPFTASTNGTLAAAVFGVGQGSEGAGHKSFPGNHHPQHLHVSSITVFMRSTTRRRTGRING